MTNKQIQKEIQEMNHINLVLKSGASMVGFDIDSETEKAEKSMDRRVAINIYQKHRINFLKSLLTK